MPDETTPSPRPRSEPTTSGTRAFGWVLIVALFVRNVAIPVILRWLNVDPSSPEANAIADYAPAALGAAMVGYLTALGTRLRDIVHDQADKSRFFRIVAVLLP